MAANLTKAGTSLAEAASPSVADVAGASFHVGSHVKLLRRCGEYYYGKVIGAAASNRRIEWDDGVTTWLPAYRLEPHGVETELGWDVP